MKPQLFQPLDSCSDTELNMKVKYYMRKNTLKRIGRSKACAL